LKSSLSKQIRYGSLTETRGSIAHQQAMMNIMSWMRVEPETYLFTDKF
jgi:hypothetical protein